MTEKVRSLVERDFPEETRAEALRLLSLFAGDAEAYQERIQLGVLKLCKGDLQELARLIDCANLDYRDVLYWAEYLPPGVEPPKP